MSFDSDTIQWLLMTALYQTLNTVYCSHHEQASMYFCFQNDILSAPCSIVEDDVPVETFVDEKQQIAIRNRTLLLK